ncbi:MAG: cbb3-type cytochrome oxidase assembly protein [Candidatus Melainabacteria bacterium]|nr:cbb3-type cytochrome oxidase assembly protein [Candidatus Melainabacteria bacterium]
MCPACLSGGIGPAYIAAFAICILFFLIAGISMLWASKNGHLEGLEDAKYRMLDDEH